MASIAGEAAVRIVPSVRGFHSDVKRKLEAKRVDFDVNVNSQVAGATTKLEAFRKAQEARPVTVHVRTDFDGLKRDLAQVEHIFKRNSFSRALRFNVVIMGLDALPVLAYGAAGAAASLDTLAKAAYALPGALGGALASVGTLGVGLHGVKDAFKAFDESQKQAATNARIIQDDNRQLARSYRDYGTAVRDTIRDIQDLNAENRRSSLNVADAILGVQEAADRLRVGGQKTILELRRDQLGYLQAVDRLQEVQTRAGRVSQDVAKANAEGVQGADKVVDALDQINKNLEKLNTDSMNKVDEAFSSLAPNARSFVEAVRSVKDEWQGLSNTVQNNLFAGLDQTFLQLSNNTLPMLERGMGRVATSYNGLIKNLATELGSQQSTSLMDKIFGNTDVGVQKLSVGMKPFVDGMLRLTKESSDFLPRLGEASAKVATRFDNWVAKISNDGRLDRWIDKGLDGFTNLGNTVVNIGSAISSMSDAFDRSTGNQGGFLKLLETQSKRLADFLKSAEGQRSMGDYFKKTQDFIKALKDAYVDIKPLIANVVDTAREWSIYLFKGIGAFASFTMAVEKHLGIIKPLLMAYFTYRTTKPIWEMLSGSFKAYTGLIESAGRNQTLGQWKFFDWQMKKLDEMRGKAKQTAKEVAESVDPASSKSKKKATSNAIKSSGAEWVSPVVEARRNREKATAAVTGYGDLGSYGSGDAVFAARQRDQQKRRGEKALAEWNAEERSRLAAIKNFEAANPPFPYQYPSPVSRDGLRSSKPSVRRDAKRQMRRLGIGDEAFNPRTKAALESFIGGTPVGPGPARMQGPALPPEILNELKNSADKASDAVQSVGSESAKATEKVKELDNKSKATATSVGDVGEKSKKAKGEVEDSGKKAKNAAKNVDALDSSSSKAAKSADSVGKAAGGMKTPLDNAKTAVKGLADEVGDQRIGLGGRLIGFAAMLGPQLGLIALIGGVSYAIEQMGKAHRDAGDAAKHQADQLSNLKGTLDQVTGAFTMQTYDQIGKDLESVKPGGGFGTQEFNVLPMMQRLGMNVQQSIINAGSPTKASAFQQDISGLYNLTRLEVEKTEEFKRNKENFASYGITSDVLAKALLSEPESLKKVEAALRDSAQPGKYGIGGVPMNLPDLGRLSVALPNKDSFLTGFALNNIQRNNAAAGNQIYQRNRMLGGAMPKPAAVELFGAYGAAPDGFFFDPATREGRAQINVKPDQATIDAWAEKGIRFEDNVTAPYQVRIDPQNADDYLTSVPGFASGGMVRGPGGPTDDKILAKVSPGEHVTNASAVSYYGQSLFESLNNRALPKFNVGGWPFPLKPMPSPDPGGGSGTVAPSAASQMPLSPPRPVAPPPVAPPVVTPPASAAPGGLSASFNNIRSGMGGGAGFAYMPLFGTNQAVTSMGDLQSGPAWSTMKVPIALAAYRNSGALSQDMVNAITLSDNAAADRLWASLGDPATAASKVQGILRSAGDEQTIVNSARSNEFSAYGQTNWSLGNQLKFMASLSQDPSSKPILDLMSQIDPSQSWGLGGVDGAQFKGGWGPNAAGRYMARQMGIVDGPGGKYAVALSSMPESGEFGDATSNLGKMTGLLNSVPQNPMAPMPITTGPGGVAPTGATPHSQLQQGYTNPAAAYSLAALMNGKTPYSMGGYSPAGIDCSGMVGAVVNSYLGQSPFTDKPSTRNLREWLTKRGFTAGKGPAGSLRVGWYDKGTGIASDGHTAITMPDGTNVESSSGVGVRMGGGASGSDAEMFDQHMWLPASAFNGVGAQGVAGSYMPGMPQIPGFGPLLNLGANGMYPGGLDPNLLTADQIQQPAVPETELDKMLRGWQEDPMLPQFLKPQQLLNFFSSQTGQVASSLLGIGTNFLSGITGIDFNWISGLAQNIGNAGSQALTGWLPSYITDPQTGQTGTPQAGTASNMLSSILPPEIGNLLGLGGSGSGGGGLADIVAGASPGTDMAGSIVEGYVNGQLPLDDPKIQKEMADRGFNSGLLGGEDSGAASMSEESIRAAVDSMGASLGISKNPEAWVQGLINASNSGSDLFNPEGNPNLGTPVQKAGAALSKAVRKWGINANGGPENISFAGGGSMIGDLALLSNGEFRTSPQATSHYGSALFDALNAKAIPRQAIRGFAAGGWPSLIPDPFTPQGATGQTPGPLPMPPPAALDAPAPPPPQISVGAQQGSVPVPSTGGEPGPGATAPAPDPGSLPGVNDALAGLGSAAGGIGGGGGGLAQPGASGANQGDPRGVLGAAPENGNHTSPVISGAISGAASTIGSLAATAAQVGMMAGTMGAGAAVPGASGAAGAGIQAGFQMGGAIVNGAVNILSSLLVGTATNGSTSSASGVPLLPQRQPMQSGVPAMNTGRVHNGDIYVTNLDDYRRTTERMDAQATMPFIGKY
jgi:methyl-accepting chemotaxis protein